MRDRMNTCQFVLTLLLFAAFMVETELFWRWYYKKSWITDPYGAPLVMLWGPICMVVSALIVTGLFR